MFAVASGKAQLWDASNTNALLSFKFPYGRVNSVDFSPDGTRVVVGSFDEGVSIWDAATAKPLFQLQKNTLVAVAFVENGGRILTASQDGLELWNAADGVLIKKINLKE